MNNKPIYKPVLLITGGGLVIISVIIGFLVPDSQNYSPAVLFQLGLLEFTSGIMGLLGWVLLLVWLILFIRKQRRKVSEQSHCSACGAIIPSKEDVYCRACGARI
jgi:hypothetical protein